MIISRSSSSTHESNEWMWDKDKETQMIFWFLKEARDDVMVSKKKNCEWCLLAWKVLVNCLDGDDVLDDDYDDDV